MGSAAILGFGSTLSRNGNLIAEQMKFTPPKISLGTVAVTNHQSPGNFEEFIAGKLSAGDVGMSGNFIPGDANGQMGLYADILASTLQAFILTLPNALAAWAFSAFVTEFAVGDLTVDGAIPFTATLKITGQPTLTTASSAGLTTPFLAFSTGTIIPVAAQSVLAYVLEVVTGTTGITITPTAAAGVITITANGASQVVTSGQASSSIPLGAAGSVTVVAISVKETNKAAKVYQLNVARA